MRLVYLVKTEPILTMEKYTHDPYAKEIGRKDEKVANHRKERSVAPRRALREETVGGTSMCSVVPQMKMDDVAGERLAPQGPIDGQLVQRQEVLEKVLAPFSSVWSRFLTYTFCILLRED
jgi:hypothetical protein